MNAQDDKGGRPSLSQEELTLLLGLGERLVSELDLDNVLSLVAEVACQVVQAETLAVPIIDGHRQTFTYRAASGAYAATILGQTFPIREGACGWVLQNQRPLLFGAGGSYDLDTSARWQPGMASSLLVPLICRGVIIGGLSAMGKDGGGAFDLRDLMVLTLFANQASIAIDNARLFQDLHAEKSRLQLVLDSAGEAIYGMDTAGRCTFANPACLRMLGYGDEAELIGRDMHATIHHTRPDGSAFPVQECHTHQSMVDGHAAHIDAEVHWRRDGTSFPVEYWAHPMLRDGQIVGTVVTFLDITERKEAEEQIRNLAFYDPLTRLPNRRLVLDRLQQALTSSARHNRYGALMLLDMDDFKTLNDTLGHDVGDRFLVEVANRVQACVREGDTVARQGGDEFVVILEDLNEDTLAAMQAESVAVKIHRAINQPYQLYLNVPGGMQHTRSYHCTSSIGITLFRGNAISVDELMKRADTAMYQAKAAGRNTLRFFDPEMQATVNARAALDSDLREAVRENQFLLYYQPQVDAGGRMTGAEALVRWRHPRRGIVSPAEFIPQAEVTGLIQPIGHWVLETACGQLVAWAAQPEMSDLTLAVNVSARQFRHPDFVDQVMAVLESSGANPKKLKLELTESLLLEDVEDIIAKMGALKAKGVGFSLDDFGTGYSSLSYLKRLPLDQLKIDQSFVRDVLTDPNDAAIARTIVALAQSMGLAVIAEGVETGAQREFLATNGCVAYQGYFFGRPMSAEEFGLFRTRH